MPEVGDRIEVGSFKAGARTGIVAQVNETLIAVLWDSGYETVITPAPGTLRVVHHGGTPRLNR